MGQKYTDEDRTNDFNFFVDNYYQIFDLYGHKFIAIKDKHILGAFDSIPEAFNKLSNKYELGTYIVQECNGDESGYTVKMTRFFIKG